MKKKYILSIDGGGVRTIASIMFLKELEAKLKIPLAQKFDFFIGTSAGAISCLGLAINQMPAADLMKFWSTKIGNKIININYENFVNNFESETKNLIEKLGIKWEENLKNYNENNRPVQTASLLQVRGKIKKNTSEKNQIYKLGEESIKVSICNLLTFPYIKKSVENKTLSIHGLMHDIGSGELKFLNPITENFENI